MAWLAGEVSSMPTTIQPGAGYPVAGEMRWVDIPDIPFPGFTAWRELFIDIDFPTFRVRARPYDHAWDGA